MKIRADKSEVKIGNSLIFLSPVIVNIVVFSVFKKGSGLCTYVVLLLFCLLFNFIIITLVCTPISKLMSHIFHLETHR